jgi:hypothetical protein
MLGEVVLGKGKNFTAVGKLLSENTKGCCAKLAGYLLMTCVSLPKQR